LFILFFSFYFVVAFSFNSRIVPYCISISISQNHPLFLPQPRRTEELRGNQEEDEQHQHEENNINIRARISDQDQDQGAHQHTTSTKNNRKGQRNTPHPHNTHRTAY
jgi:hypothetical protein